MNGRNWVSLVLVPLSTLITIILIILKATGVIAWSWLWVLSPAWIPVALPILGSGLALLWIILEIIFTPPSKREQP